MEAENALQANIKQKGENSYYYAHQPRQTAETVQAVALEGEGIVTGGHPKLAEVRDPVPHSPVIVPIRNYSWADDTDKISVIISFNTASLVQEQVQCNFYPKSLDLSVRVGELEEHKLALRKLSHEVVPEQCRIRVKNNRVTLVLKKEVSSKWFNLVEGARMDDDRD